ncbi:hypothetical protein QQS21_003701 [Conoideocrella luteorostrata]|uniref:NmrA-like domain-containing protein n=1 Tax=Conoideocrella luteorostrata TaxID=1105319 RepID=A0AAJ0CSQ7_9HYPO|nr:hypothetical protein QQS21_003701 [Conoideocrella luteorostrata]
MAVVVVAGGLGDMGRLITEALQRTGKHEVYVMSRRTPQQVPSPTSPITGAQYKSFIQTDYSSEDHLAEHLTQHNVQVVICAFSLHYQSASDAQVRLIRAADRAPTVKRFIPSEFNVDYDLGDDVLPYPDKKYHLDARRQLEKTGLEFTYIYPGMFMDYFGMPKVPTHLRELCFFVDAVNGVAAVPEDGSAKMSMSFTTDVARYTALALDLEKWPRVMTTAASTVSISGLVKLVEKSLGQSIEVRYQAVETLRLHQNIILPQNASIAGRFLRGSPKGCRN